MYSQGAGSIGLYKDLIIESEYIGLVQGIAVDSKGRIYVGDLVNQKIHVFAKSGEYLKSIGKKGEGPGEFKIIGGLQIYDDTLFVYDWMLYRITVFAPDKFDKPEYTIKIPVSPKGEGPTMIGFENLGFTGLWLIGSDFLIPYSRGFSAFDLGKPVYVNFYRVSHNGQFIVSEPLFSIEDKRWFVISSGGKFMVLMNPIGSGPVVYVKGKRVYYGSNENLDIKFISVDTKNTKVAYTIKYPIKRISVTEEMLRNLLSQQLDMGVIREIKRQIPKYMPAFKDFLVDDRNRIWIALNGENLDETIWLILSDKGDKISEFRLHSSVIFKVVKNGYAYGILTDKDGIQKIVRYKIVEK